LKSIKLFFKKKGENLMESVLSENTKERPLELTFWRNEEDIGFD